VAGELISGLAEVLGVVLVAFVKDVGADVQGVVLLFCLVARDV
jgi:hypothetical protein